MIQIGVMYCNFMLIYKKVPVIISIREIPLLPTCISN